MGRTRFSTGKRKDIFLYSTTVENLFINEFLPDAPGDCVKVFLFGLMYAQYDEEISNRTLALTLGMSEKDVDNAWKYWESKGLVRLANKDDDVYIEFVRQIDLFYGKTIEESYPVPQPAGTSGKEAEEGQQKTRDADRETDEGAEELIARLINQQLREIFDKYQMLTGRTMSRHEAGKLTDAVKVYSIEPDILDFAIDYCVGLDKYSVDYIFKVALRWTEEGCRDVAEVKQMLDKHSRRNEFYRQVFNALGWNRMPAPADREIMDGWFDTMGYSIKDVLDACKASAGIREPNLRYVNKVLENKMLEKGGINTRAQNEAQNAPQKAAHQDLQPEEVVPSQARVSRKVLREYFDYLRQEGEKEYNARLDEVQLKIPAMRDVFAAEMKLNNALISLGPGPDSREKRQQLREKRRALEDRKKELLVSGGYPEDYAERRYKCGICRDTGITDEGRVCTCCRQRAEEAYTWIQNIKK